MDTIRHIVLFLRRPTPKTPPAQYKKNITDFVTLLSKRLFNRL